VNTDAGRSRRGQVAAAHHVDGELSRRTVVVGACVLVAASVAGCAAGVDNSEGPTNASKGLGSTSDIPLGGGRLFAEQEVVVTQPAAGVFQAFSAICTHRGCTINEVAGGTINCPCHGSKFSSTDGSVINGPAERPLPRRGITVDGADIALV
jgi:Rieske Fe-S protein